MREVQRSDMSLYDILVTGNLPLVPLTGAEAQPVIHLQSGRTRALTHSSTLPARVAKLADARDLKSRVPKGTYRFDSDPGHHLDFAVRLTSIV